MNKKIRQIAVYGKGGIGKSTTSSNLTAALSYMNTMPAQIGCDPKADSVNTLMKGEFIETVSDLIREYGESEETINEAVYKGFNDILCMEAGGPVPGQGCAGRGVLVALELIKKYRIFEKNQVDLAVYDVLGDIVCGGFAQPVRHSYAEEVYIVTSGEYMSLYAANNIASSIKLFSSQGLNVSLGGIIANLRNVEREKEIVDAFSAKIQVPVVQYIPRSDYVQKSELLGQTVIESFPDVCQAEVYFELAYKILNNKQEFLPNPLSRKELIELLNTRKTVF